ncbi:hypothetical protein GMDG_08457, partial [Pseudogymnoascus destructans 20631-21]
RELRHARRQNHAIVGRSGRLISLRRSPAKIPCEDPRPHAGINHQNLLSRKIRPSLLIREEEKTDDLTITASKTGGSRLPTFLHICTFGVWGKTLLLFDRRYKSE